MLTGMLKNFAAVAILCASSTGLLAAEWNPTRPLTVVIPFNAGGGTDVYARALVAAAGDSLPVPIVIVNKPGAGGMTGSIQTASAKPDGNTILMTASGSFLLGSMLNDTEINPFDSFQTIAQAGNLKGALAVPASSPFETVDDLVKAIQEAPGKLRWSHNGKGTGFHVLGQTFLNKNDLDTVDVPYTGGGASRTAIIGGQVDFGFIGIHQAKGFEEMMRILAVADDQRDVLSSDVPTFKEAGYPVPNISNPIIFFAPNGVDVEIVKGIEAMLKAETSKAAFSEMLAPKGVHPLFLSGADAEANLREMQDASTAVINALK